MSFRLTAFPRIHVGLLDLAGTTSRTYGGLGFALQGPTTRISLAPSRAFSLHLPHNYDEDAKREIQAALERLSLSNAPWTLQVDTDAIPHVGLGTKTTLILAILAALNHVEGRRLQVDALQRASHRGGASGIGINGFFVGGWLWDAGHHKDLTSPDLKPSSARKGPVDPPPIACRITIPHHWRVALLLPQGNRLSGTDEVDLFRRNTPIPASEATKAIRIAYHDILPSVLTSDLAALRRGLTAFRDIGFKSREIAEQEDSVRSCLTLLDEQTTYASGMSSLGPLVYVIHPASDSVAVSRIKGIAQHVGANYLGTFAGRNSPYAFEDTEDRY